MTDLTIVPKWNAAINRLERNEFATGGADGNMNIAPRQLAENVFWLKNDIDRKIDTLNQNTLTQDDAINSKASTIDVDTKNVLQDAAINNKAGKAEVDTKNDLQDAAIAKNATDIQALSASPVGSASTTKAGIVQLSTATNSTSTTLAATASAVKAAFDKSNAAIPNTAKGANNGVATLGSDGKVPSAQLPAMSSNIPNFYWSTTTEPPNTYIDSAGNLKRSNNYSNAASRTVGHSTSQLAEYDAQGGLGEQGYIQAGFGAPKVKNTLYTGYLNNINGSETQLDTGINSASILSVSVFVLSTTGLWVTGEYNATSYVKWRLSGSVVLITNSSNYNNRPYKVFLTYEA